MEHKNDTVVHMRRKVHAPKDIDPWVFEKFYKEYFEAFERLSLDEKDRKILLTIPKLHGMACFAELSGALVPKDMTKLTLTRHLRSLRRRGILSCEPGVRHGRPVFFYTFGSNLVKRVVGVDEKTISRLLKSVAREIEGEADANKRATLERWIRDLLGLQHYLTLISLEKGLRELPKGFRKIGKRRMKEIVMESPQFRYVEKFVLAEHRMHLLPLAVMFLCLVYPELAKPIIQKLREEFSYHARVLDTEESF